MFDRFFRDPQQTQSGSGLGLSIARSAAQQHGGTISLSAAPGGGLLAQVRLPLAPPRTGLTRAARLPLHNCKIRWTAILRLSMLTGGNGKRSSKRCVIHEADMHGLPASYAIAATPPAEASTVPPSVVRPVSDAELTLLLRARDIEREVMALRGLLLAAAVDAGRQQQLKEEIVRLLSKVIIFRAGLARE